MRRRRRTPKDFDAEIQAHVELETSRFKDQGMSEEQARMAAHRSFGNMTEARERFYDSTRWIGSSLFEDVRFGLRMLGKTPGSTAVAILTLALGIGANTAVFSLLNAVLLRNLPVQRPGELVLFGKGEWVGSQNSLPDGDWQLFSYPFFRDFREHNQAFSDVAAISSILFGTHGQVGGGTIPEKISIELISGSYFHTLGVGAAAGRVLTPEDDRIPGGHPVAVASYQYWQRRLTAGQGAIGTAVTIGSTVYTVIGVAQRGFFGVSIDQSPDLWIPLAMEKEISPGWNGITDPLFQSLYLVGRLKPGVTIGEANKETNIAFKQHCLRLAGPQPSRKDAESIRRARIDLTPAATGLSQLRQQFATPLKTVMVIVGLVLLIACANVANLLLARAVSRAREMAVRMSLGAGRARLIRQLLVESALLGISGAAAGVAFAIALIRLFPGIVPPDSAASLNVAPDLRVLGFTVAVSMLTVVLFGTVPALYTTRFELAPSLKDGRSVVTPASHNFFSHALIAGQVALSLVLLAGAGLFLRSLQNVMRVDPGFDRKVLIAGIDPTGYQVNARLETMMQHVEEQVSALPGVQNASFVFSTFGGGWTDPVTVPGRQKSAHDRDVFHNVVGTRYLEVMKTPLILGRSFNERDTLASRKIAIINGAMARSYFAGISPIGRTFSIENNPEWKNIEVVGVARNAKYMSLRERERPAAFYPHSQHSMFLYTLIANYTGDRQTAVQQIRKAIHAAAPDILVGDFQTFESLIEQSVLNQRLITELSTVFGLVAALLSCIGIYGVVSYTMARRTKEFGLRMALGAVRIRVLGMVLAETSRVLLTGLVLGTALALASVRLIQTQLFGVGPYDPLALSSALMLMLAVALLSALIPARGATRVDPMVALRCE